MTEKQIPAPGKPRTLSQKIRVVIFLIIFLMVAAVIAGFVSDLIVWSWDTGRNFIN